jgi:hypothetical protein
MTEQPEAIRASDADRELALQRLNLAVGDGRLGIDEFSARTDLILRAGTRGELDRVLADLPAPSLRSEPSTLVLRTGSGSVRQNGCWVVPPRVDVECGVGRILVDFSDASCAHREVSLHVTMAKPGRVTVVVPKGWLVRVEEAQATHGRVLNKATAPADDRAPMLRVFADVGGGRLKLKH